MAKEGRTEIEIYKSLDQMKTPLENQWKQGQAQELHMVQPAKVGSLTKIKHWYLYL